MTDHMSHADAEDYTANGAHNMTAEERAAGIEGVKPDAPATESGTTDFELNFKGVARDGVEGDVKITVTYPKNKAILGIIALALAGKTEYGSRLAAGLAHDHSVAEALAAAGLVVMDGGE